MEEKLINLIEVRQMLFNVFKFKINEPKLLREIIIKNTPNDMILCSYRGYLTYQHAELKGKILHDWRHELYRRKKIDNLY